jgi:hypothetical protein
MAKPVPGRLEKQVRSMFPADALTKVDVLQYGEDPAVEPGDVGIRGFLPRAGRPPGRKEDEQIIEAFGGTYAETVEKLSDKLPRFVAWIEFYPEQAGDDDGLHTGPMFRLVSGDARASSLDLGAEELTPVMTRLGSADIATVDTLITAGIASSRAEALRWAVGRIRENPAYAQLQQRVNEINDLKAQF